MASRRRRTRRTRLGSPAYCPVPGSVEGFDTSYGRDALNYLRGRTRKDPYFAVVSGVMHAGQIDYNIQQPIAERLLKEPVETAFDLKKTAAITEGAQDGARVLVGLGIGAHCYIKFCRRGSCLAPGGKMSRDGESLIECLRSARVDLSPSEVEFLRSKSISTVKDPEGGKTYFQTLVDRKRLKRDAKGWYVQGAGLGSKTRNLVAEYMGCDDAVAVDRHVGHWLANTTGRVAWVQKVRITRRDRLGRKIGEFWRTSPVTLTRSKAEANQLQARGIAAVDSGAVGQPNTFALLKREVQRLARGCGIPPAELQVAAWAQSVCEPDPRRKGARTSGIYLGEGKTDSCDRVPRARVQLSDWAAPIMDRPPGASDRFTCRPGYLGQSPAGAFRLSKEPLRPPPGEFWSYRYGGLQPVRVLTQAEARGFVPSAAPMQPARRFGPLRPGFLLGRRR